MSTSIESLHCSSNNHQSYSVTFYNDQINTVVTYSASIVDEWVSDIYRDYQNVLHNLFVGLDVEWRPNNQYYTNKVAILQLCVGRRCLIFQILHADYIPNSLVAFLGNPNFTFVGVGINEDASKLLNHYGLEVGKTDDLGSWAADIMNIPDFKNASLRDLVFNLLGVQLEKPKRITMSRWDSRYLNYDQITYACIDAYVSFKMARVLMNM